MTSQTVTWQREAARLREFLRAVERPRTKQTCDCECHVNAEALDMDEAACDCSEGIVW